MKKLLLLVALFFTFVPIVFAQEEQEEETTLTEKTRNKTAQELIKIKRDWGKVYVRRDLPLLEKIIAKEYTVTDENGAVTSRDEIVADFKTSKVVYESSNYDDVKVRIYGNTAIVAGRGTVKGRGATANFHTQYFSTNVFVKRAGRWQAVATHISGVKRL